MRRAARDPRPLSPPSPLPFAFGLLLVVVLFVALAWGFAPHTVDDAWITFRYSRQWALGHGPYFNPGEHVEGYSNFLLMLLLAPVVAWGGADAALPAAKVIGLASGALAVLGAGLLARRAAAPARWAGAAGIAAALLAASFPGFAYHSMSGLETSLYACLLVWGVRGLTAASSRATVLGGVALAAAAITRPEGPLLFALAWGVAAVTRLRRAGHRDPERLSAADAGTWRPLLVVALIGGVVIVCQVAFRHAFYDGEWLPNTYYAKSGGSGDRVAYVRDALRGACFGDVGSFLALAGWIVGGGSGPVAWAAALLGLVGALLPLATGGDWMPGARLVVPYLPLTAVAVVHGWGRFAARLLGDRLRLSSAVLLIAAAANFGVQWQTRESLQASASVEAAGATTGHGALAVWLSRHARPGEAIVLMDIGEVGYRCIDQHIVDVTGLTDRHIAKSPGTFMAKSFDLGYVFERRPEFIVLTFFGRGEALAPLDATAPLYPFSEMEHRLAAHPAFGRDYYRVPEPGDAPAEGIGRLRRSLGAEAVFPYATPGRRYVLAVYARHH